MERHGTDPDEEGVGGGVAMRCPTCGSVLLAILLAIFLAVWPWSAGAQATPDASVGAALRSLASRSGVVFVGQVTGVTRRGGVVEIVFQVDHQVLGVVGGAYTLREWAGLWPLGEHPFRVGQRAMVFLHADGRAGLSSPVDGMEGVVPVVPMGADVAPLLDVRRLEARVLRAQDAPMVDAGAIAMADAVGVVTAWRKPVFHEPVRLPLPVRVRGVAIDGQ